MKKVLIFFSAIVITGVLGGCASQGRTGPTDPLCLADSNAVRTMEAASVVLRSIQFQIEKYDEEAGYIRTRPLSGGQFFEFWQHDNASAYAAAQSNLQSIQRIVEIEVYPNGSSTCLRCSVQVMQLSVPEKPIGGMIMLPRTLTGVSQSNQTLIMSPARAEQVQWLDAGHDHALENSILRKINKKLKQDV